MILGMAIDVVVVVIVAPITCAIVALALVPFVSTLGGEQVRKVALDGHGCS